MENIETKLLLKQMVELMADLTESVAVLLEQVKPPQPKVRTPLSPNLNAGDIRKKFAAVHAQLGRVQ